MAGVPTKDVHTRRAHEESSGNVLVCYEQQKPNKNPAITKNVLAQKIIKIFYVFLRNICKFFVNHSNFLSENYK